jgi:glycerophosphoryl diester phosphodiesterase
MGCSWVEFDVRLTADDAPVVCHDDRLDRTTNGRGCILKQPLATIREFDAGSWFAARFVGERVPTLDEALELCAGLGLGANVEIKAEHGHGPATAAAVAECLRRPGGDPPPVLLSSFLPDAVAAAAEHAPSVPRAMLFRKVPRNWRDIVERMGCATVNANQLYLKESMAREIRANGYPLLVYTVNDPARARELFSWGVTSVFSDAPDIMLAAVAPETGDDARRGAMR